VILAAGNQAAKLFAAQINLAMGTHRPSESSAFPSLGAIPQSRTIPPQNLDSVLPPVDEQE
jgi:hypothetical protein